MKKPAVSLPWHSLKRRKIRVATQPMSTGGSAHRLIATLPQDRENGLESRGCAAFTLVELLIALGLVAFLGVLLAFAAGKVKKGAMSARCAGNLRQIGAAMHLYAGENNQMLDMMAYKGDGTSIGWLKFLRGRVTANFDRGSGGPVYLSNSSIAACPAFPPFSNSNDSDYCYGAIQQATDPYSRPQAVPDIMAPSRRIPVMSVTEPSKYWLLADSFNPDRGRQQFYMIHPTSPKYSVHLLHGGRANVLFLDGHVEQCSGDDFKKFIHNPLTVGFDANQNAVHF